LAQKLIALKCKQKVLIFRKIYTPRFLGCYILLAYARSLEAQLKAPIPTICSTCEVNAVKNMELAHYVDCLQDENDELRKLMG
jgi:hypothetical protein